MRGMEGEKQWKKDIKGKQKSGREREIMGKFIGRQEYYIEKGSCREDARVEGDCISLKGGKERIGMIWVEYKDGIRV